MYSLIALVGSTFLFLLLIHYCYFGFDITDEGLYLVSIADPLAYKETVSFYGLIYNPIFNLIGGDIVVLRIFNLAITLAAASFFINTLLSYLEIDFSSDPMAVWGVTIPLAFIALIFLNLWLPTPNYNSLNLIGLMLAASAVVFISNKNYASPVNAWILLGFAGWIVFVVKATSGVFLGIAALCFLVITRSFKLGRLVIACLVSVTLLFATAMITDGSVTEFIERIDGGLTTGKLLLGEARSFENMLWRGQLELPQIVGIHIAILSMSLAAALIASNLKSRQFNFATDAIIVLLIVYCAFILFSGAENPLISVPATRRLLILWALPLALVSTWILNLTKAGIQRKAFNAEKIALFVFLFILPYGYAFGTYNDYFYVTANAGIFLIGAAIIPLTALETRANTVKNLSVVSIFSICICILVIQAGVQQPYRQNAGQLEKDTVKTKIERFGKRLRLPLQTENYLLNLKNNAYQNGFLTGTPIIDLTGASPGTMYALGARSLGSPWFAGGYSGSEKRAIHALKKVDEHLVDQAWVIVELEGPRSLSNDVLASLGRDLARDYELVAEIILPSGLGGRNTATIQRLYKPNSSGNES